MLMNHNDMSTMIAPAYRDISDSKAFQLLLPDPPSLLSAHQWEQRLPPSWQQGYYIHQEVVPPYSPMDTDDWISEPDVDVQPSQAIIADNASNDRFSQLTCLQIGLCFDNVQTRMTALLKGLPRLTDLLLVADRDPRESLPDIRVYHEGDELDDTDALDPPDILHNVCTALQSVQYGWRHRDAPLLCPELVHLAIIFPQRQEPTSTVSLHALGSMMLFRLKEGCPLQSLTVEAASSDAAADAAEPTSAGIAEAPHTSESRIHIPASTLGWGLDQIGELDGAPRAVVDVEDTIHNLVGCYLVERLQAPPEPWFQFAEPDSDSQGRREARDWCDDLVPRGRVFPPGAETKMYRFVYPPSVGLSWSGRS